MAWWNAIPVMGNVIGGIFDLIGENVEDKDQANQLRAQLEEVLLNSDLEKFQEQIKAQASVIIAEAKGESWLQRNWRPGLMALFGIIIMNNYITNPYASALLGINIVMEIPPDMWDLLKLGVGGYIFGRSTEKGIAAWKKKN
jgi:hypothetical protein